MLPTSTTASPGRVFRPQREPSLFRNLRAYLLRNRLPSIILLPSERIPSVSLRKGMRIFCQKRASLSVLVCCFILSEANLACYDHGYYMVIGALRATESIYARIRPGGMLLVQLVEDISPASYKPAVSANGLTQPTWTV